MDQDGVFFRFLVIL